MKSKTTEQQKRISASEWLECEKHEARSALILLHGIKHPTDRQIVAYLLFGEKSLNRRKV